MCLDCWVGLYGNFFGFLAWSCIIHHAFNVYDRGTLISFTTHFFLRFAQNSLYLFVTWTRSILHLCWTPFSMFQHGTNGNFVALASTSTWWTPRTVFEQDGGEFKKKIVFCVFFTCFERIFVRTEGPLLCRMRLIFHLICRYKRRGIPAQNSLFCSFFGVWHASHRENGL